MKLIDLARSIRDREEYIRIMDAAINDVYTDILKSYDRGYLHDLERVWGTIIDDE